MKAAVITERQIEQINDALHGGLVKNADKALSIINSLKLVSPIGTACIGAEFDDYGFSDDDNPGRKVPLYPLDNL